MVAPSHFVIFFKGIVYIMKNFLKIFIFLEIILLAYIFNTSIYNIYEKNNIATEKLEGYVLEETSPEILNKFYTIFTEKYSLLRFFSYKKLT